jgi:glutaredoxin
MRRALVTLLLVLALAPGCRRKDDGTAPHARELPALVLRDDTPDLLLTWVDGRGEFHIAMKVAEVPPEGREAVRVVVTTRDDGATTDLVYVARLTEKKPDGTYAVSTMARTEWEALAESRRSPKVATAPRPSGEPPARPPQPGQNAGRVTVIIYGASWCGPCHDAQAHLKRRGVPFIYKDVEEDSGAAREMSRKLEKAGTRGGSIPVIDVGGRVLIGFDPGALDAAVSAAGRDGTEM